jgi:hypothetical protein
VSQTNAEIAHLKSHQAKQKSEFQKEHAEKETKHKHIRQMLDLEINRLQDEYRAVLQKSTFHEQNFLNLKKESSDWGPESFSKRVAIEKNSMKK